jgi:hypothetical protein
MSVGSWQGSSRRVPDGSIAPGSVLSFGARRLRGQPHSSPTADNLWSDGGPGRTGSSRLVVRETVASVDLQYNES